MRRILFKLFLLLFIFADNGPGNLLSAQENPDQIIIDEDGVMRIIRTFAPAGEIISDLVRRYTTQWGLPHGV